MSKEINLSTKDLVDLLIKKDPQEIKYALLIMLVNNKLDFNDLNSAYVDYLQIQRDNNKLDHAELNACLLQLLSCSKKDLNNNENNIIQRALYSLNKDKYFAMESTNKQFSYIGDKEAKKLTCYD